MVYSSTRIQFSIAETMCRRLMTSKAERRLASSVWCVIQTISASPSGRARWTTLSMLTLKSPKTEARLARTFGRSWAVRRM